MNSHSFDNYNDPFPAGFTGSDFLLDPGTFQFLRVHDGYLLVKLLTCTIMLPFNVIRIRR